MINIYISLNKFVIFYWILYHQPFFKFEGGGGGFESFLLLLVVVGVLVVEVGVLVLEGLETFGVLFGELLLLLAARVAGFFENIKKIRIKVIKWFLWIN